MAKILSAEPAIKALEDVVISPCSNIVSPTLGLVVKPEDDPKAASDWSYVKSLLKRAEGYGAKVKVSVAGSLSEAYQSIASMRNDYRFDGLAILSSYGNDQYLKDYIPTPLDLDCSSSQSLGRMICDNSQTFYRMAPCTAAAIYKLLTYNGVQLAGKRVGVIGRSMRVGRPTAQLLSLADATVTLYHSKSDLSTLKEEDIIVSAVGKPGFLKEDSFRKGQVVVDVGVNVDVPSGKLCGDVDYDPVFKVLGDDGMITPVPNGLGPLTSTIMFSKLFVNAIRTRGGMDPAGAEIC